MLPQIVVAIPARDRAAEGVAGEGGSVVDSDDEVSKLSTSSVFCINNTVIELLAVEANNCSLISAATPPLRMNEHSPSHA